MNHTRKWRCSSLSPYAQALKHVALRGAGALRLSSRESELKLFAKGQLPADYRPFVQGKWDDTIERWAFSWQFPAVEDVAELSNSATIQKSATFPELVAFTRKLRDCPPSAVAGSSKTSSEFPPVSMELPNLIAASSSLASDTTTDLSSLLNEAKTILSEAGERTTTPIPPSVPAAYIDNGSELTSASKTLCLLFERLGLSFEEPALAAAIRALVESRHAELAESLFSFAKAIGLGPTSDMYRSLMRQHTLTGNVNQSMMLIEDMKAAGITPRIGNWHELMQCFLKAKDYPAVQQIVDNMKMYGNIEPNETTFVLQLRALAKDKTRLSAVPEAIQLFDQMENVNGFVASRPHYHALMACLCQSALPERRQRCEDLGKKMEMMGIVWDSHTYLYQIMSAQVVGDTAAIAKLFAKMRNNGIEMHQSHLAWAIHGHTRSLLRQDYAVLRETNQDLAKLWLDQMDVCFGIYELVMKRGWRCQVNFLNSLLHQVCQVTMLAMEHTPDDTQLIGRLETQAQKLWSSAFEEVGLSRDTFSYQCYIALLAHQQRIDEAEKLFQELTLTRNETATRTTYECLVFMHLSSGEEGGAARALQYLEAMERSGITVRPSLIKKIVRVNQAAGYRRDMKRRARRIMQAREEYIAKKQEGVDLSEKPYEPPQRDSEGNLVPVPLPISPNSALAWWKQWRDTTVSKHELFETEREDGMPRGESFEEKNQALAALGIESKFPTKESVPNPDSWKLLPLLRKKEGEVAGSIWGLDGGELSYPKDGHGPQGWGVRLWRDRQLLKKEFDKGMDGVVPLSDFSNAGIAARNVNDQLAIEQHGLKHPGELADVRKYPEHVYDDGTPKPVSEHAVNVSPAAELVWHQERQDRLAPYRTDDEIALAADSAFHNAMKDEAEAKTAALVQVLQNKQENDEELYHEEGPTRKSKYDYLAKWRDMYRHGTLEAPDEPLEVFGRDPEDALEATARQARTWHGKRSQQTSPQDSLERTRRHEQRTSTNTLKMKKRLRKLRR